MRAGSGDAPVLAFAAIWIIVPSRALNLLDEAVDLIASV
jgi:hypothetical protein